MDEEKKMKTFEVECQMTYYGRVRVEAADATCALEQVDDSLNSSVSDDFPDVGKFGCATFDFGNAQAIYAEEIKDDTAAIEDTRNLYRNIVDEIADSKGVAGFSLNPSEAAGFTDLFFTDDGQLFARHESNTEGLFVSLSKEQQKTLVKAIL